MTRKETRTLQQQFKDEVKQKQPGLVPGMPDYIKWLGSQLHKEYEAREQAERGRDELRDVLNNKFKED